MSLFAVLYQHTFTTSKGEVNSVGSTYVLEARDSQDAFAQTQAKFAEWWPRKRKSEYPVITDVHPATLAQFWDVLDGFDWYYMMSDDGSVYRAGERGYQRIFNMAKAGGPDFEALFEKFGDHKFSGEPWGTPNAPRPERPQSNATHL